MKTKLLFLLSSLVLSGLLLGGCYTQVAQPDRDHEPRISREAEAEEETSGETASEEASEAEQQTNVYIYGSEWYGPYDYPWWYRYPYSRFHVSIGFGYRDPWDWCGTPWDWWYDPWCWDRYHAVYWRPYYWYPGYYDPYFYYPSPYVYRDRVPANKKRDFTRRGVDTGSDDRRGSYSTPASGGRGSLSKPVSGTFARGDDGIYRRQRRGDATTTLRRNQPATDSDYTRPIDSGRRDDSGRRATKRTIGDSDNNNRTPVDRRDSSGDSQNTIRRTSKPAPPSHDSGSVSRRSGSSGSSGSGGTISKPSGSGSSGSAPAPKSSGNSSNKSGSSSNRRSRN